MKEIEWKLKSIEKATNMDTLVKWNEETESFDTDYVDARRTTQNLYELFVEWKNYFHLCNNIFMNIICNS